MIIRERHKILFGGLLVFYLLLTLSQTLLRPNASGDSPLVINEVMASNGDGLRDEDEDLSDWIEIYNRSHHPVSLASWSLSDDPRRPQKWVFPDRTLGGQQYLVVFASGKDRRPTDETLPLHTNFRLSRAGEYLALYNILDGQVRDALAPNFPPQYRYLSYGRYGDGSWYGYTVNDTPGMANDQHQVWPGAVAGVTFSVERGFYEEPFALTLETATPEAIIYYTTDGSTPGETNGQPYDGPIAIDRTTVVRAIALKPGFLASPVATQTYLFLDDVLTQAGMDPRLATDRDWAEQVKAGLVAIPTISIVTADDSYYIYANAAFKGKEWERRVSVELFYPTALRAEYGDLAGFQVDAGLRAQGGVARTRNKLSFRLFFRGFYGTPRLNYPVFPDSPVKSFETLILRGAGNRSYTGKPLWANDSTYTRDEWLRRTQIELSGVGSHGIFVHLYLNGLYWGLYNLVERPDASFSASYYGGDVDEWYARNQNGSIDGDKERFEDLEDFIEQGNRAGPQDYDRIQAFIDTTHFIDYILLNWYAGNDDWPHTNWYLGVRNPDGQLHYYVWDAEQIWLGEGGMLFRGSRDNLVMDILDAAMTNPDFRIEFADRVYRHFYHQGGLTEVAAKERWQRINEPVSRAIKGEMARWGVIRGEEPGPENWLKEPGHYLLDVLAATNRWQNPQPGDHRVTPADWERANQAVLAQMDGNVGQMIRLLRQAGYYPPFDPPQFNREGGPVPAGFELAMLAQDGQIYYTTDGSDPRQAGGGSVSGSARLYQAPLMISRTTQIKARLLAGQTWSALHQATFETKPALARLSLTELMYNPPGGPEYEFLELTNTGTDPLDLSGLRFTGIDFTFPSASDLAPGRTIVLVRDPVAFARLYPAVTVTGVYQGRLANGGERVTLEDSAGRVVLALAYDDENGWPLTPDGWGDSLVLVDPAADPNDPHNWRASRQLYGSPGHWPDN